VNVAVGDFVPARSTLVEIFDPASLVLRFAVSEESAARVSAGARVAVTLDAHPGWNFTAKVVRIFPEIDRATHTRTVEAEVDGKAALAPGMFARLSLTLFEAPEALAVPTEAVVERGGKKVVFVIAEDGTAAQRTVEIGIEEGGMVQLLSGATAGERVAFAGHTRLKDGQKVIVMGQPDGTQPGPKTGGVPR
jgi:membrane fusion protein (multidrug efflux system)